MNAADLLFALNDKLDPAGDIAHHLANSMKRRQTCHDMTLIIRGSTTVKLVIALGHLKGWG